MTMCVSFRNALRLTERQQSLGGKKAVSHRLRVPGENFKYVFTITHTHTASILELACGNQTEYIIVSWLDRHNSDASPGIRLTTYERQPGVTTNGRPSNPPPPHDATSRVRAVSRNRRGSSQFFSMKKAAGVLLAIY